MIALNFTVLTERDYEALTTTITTLGHTAKSRDKAHRECGASGGEVGQFWNEIIGAADGIKEECRKARYLYLKGKRWVHRARTKFVRERGEVRPAFSPAV